MIDVIVTLHIKPGMEAAAKEILRQLESETTENDKGCLRYQWYRTEHAGTYYLLERWVRPASIGRAFQSTWQKFCHRLLNALLSSKHKAHAAGVSCVCRCRITARSRCPK